MAQVVVDSRVMRDKAKTLENAAVTIQSLYAEMLQEVTTTANKMKGIRCCVCSDTFSAKYTRLHNDANVLSMGGRVVGPGLACEMVDIFLETEFEGGRHARRVEKLAQLEENWK